jgi:hypothetical protein
MSAFWGKADIAPVSQNVRYHACLAKENKTKRKQTTGGPKNVFVFRLGDRRGTNKIINTDFSLQHGIS